MARKKIALIGAGQIGGTSARSPRPRNWATSCCSTSSTACRRARRSISQSGPVEGFNAKLAGASSYDAIAGADVIIVTAGVPASPA